MDDEAMRHAAGRSGVNGQLLNGTSAHIRPFTLILKLAVLYMYTCEAQMQDVVHLYPM